MRSTPAFWPVVRLVAFVVLSWALVTWVSPIPDPFTTGVAWLFLVVALLAIPWTRWRMVRWIVTGRLRRRV